MTATLASPRATSLRRRTTTVCVLAAATVVLMVGQAFPAAAAQPRVELGVADSFAVLGGSTVTNTGPTTIVGDVGVSPDLTTPGLTGAMVTDGTIHRGDALAASAQADLTTAYDSAAGRTPASAVPTELGGQKLTGGVYTGPTLAVTGTLTLDAQGVPSTVFVFQTEALLAASSSRVVLTDGADACNVFWQVGSSATLGTDASFVGTLMALTSITANTGATVRGRLLARNGAVTLDSNDIVRPACATDPEPGGSTPASSTPAQSTPAQSTAPVDTATPSPSGVGDVPTPSVDDLSPSTGPESGGTTVVVDGSGFVKDKTSVTVGGTPATSVDVATPGRLTFVTPAGSTPTALVVVTTPGGSTPRNGLTFTYVTAAPSGSTGTTTTTLATTGVEDLDLLTGAGALLGLGLIVLFAARTPSRGRHS